MVVFAAAVLGGVVMVASAVVLVENLCHSDPVHAQLQHIPYG